MDNHSTSWATLVLALGGLAFFHMSGLVFEGIFTFFGLWLDGDRLADNRHLTSKHFIVFWCWLTTTTQQHLCIFFFFKSQDSGFSSIKSWKWQEMGEHGLTHQQHHEVPLPCAHDGTSYMADFWWYNCRFFILSVLPALTSEPKNRTPRLSVLRDILYLWF